MGLDYHVIYINLDYRIDRRQHIEGVLDSLQIPPSRRHRFPAIYLPLPWIGCIRSHCSVLELAKQEGWPAVLILEDDFSLTVSPEEFHTAMLEAQKIPHDVLLCGYNVIECEEVPGTTGVRRALSAQAPSAYLVHSHFYDRLLQNYKEALACSLAGGNHWECANDQYWKRLQADRSTMWLFCTPRLGVQMPCYSDLAKTNVDYKV